MTGVSIGRREERERGGLGRRVQSVPVRVSEWVKRRKSCRAGGVCVEKTE